ncbi:WecB/TagA/CpsF family glycosyltransferase [Ferrovibrio sp.]|uniref:WecB/TagA/CpsF family glycosyltransferase n=1 Tax=Ferrovibrio sp. TaxID=1917215 RepID=UPI001B5608B8|nr:WecB/TagA/CpsF family glycosyltransferase [Ferrovibrio sp.]MBP7064866.1 WecB/TagA/CpsF family glycosyltransferase [Ferrovibrio sp.]
MMPKIEVMGLPLHAGDLALAQAQVLRWLRAGERQYICHVNVHTLVESWRDARLHDALAHAGMAATDGMPLVWLLRRRGAGQAGRVYGPDLMTALLASGEHVQGRPLRHFLFGGSPALLAQLRRAIQQKFPGADIVGCLAPPFRPFTAAEDAAHAAAIDASGADIVWVGLGAPRQEIWMRAQRETLQVPLLVGVGAAFDFIAGNKPWAPPWMQRHGLEWAFRLASEPRRLAGRYGRTIPLFLLRLLRDEWRRRQ